MKEFLRVMTKYPNPPAVFIWGRPGVGKSAVCRQLTEEEKIGFIDFRLTLMDPTDLRGIPVPKSGRAKWLPPSALPTEGRGILFLDELNLAPPLVQSAAYQLILDGKIGEYILPAGWIIVAAGNAVGHGAHIYKMSAPLRNRFIQLDFEENIEDWLEWAVQNKIAEEVIEFLNYQPQYLFQFDPQRDDKAFPTPRSWEFVSKILKNKEGLDEKLKEPALEGTIGRGTLLVFKAYIALKEKLPSIEEILAGKKVPPPATIDVTCALVNALAIRAKPEHFETLLCYSENLKKEVAVMLGRLLIIKNQETLTKCPSWPSWSKKHYGEIV